MSNVFNKVWANFSAKLDFTLPKYIELCKKMVNSDYELLTVEKYLSMKKKPDKFIILRHDVDDGIDLPYTLKMARAEAELGIAATYYFRTHNDVFKEDVIREVASLGHEIGYHYDVLCEAEGDYERAIELFELELNKLRGVCDVKTIAMHGGPLASGLTAATFSDMLKIIKSMLKGRRTFAPWASKDLWKVYDFRKYGIIGDAYLSIDFNEVVYLSDTNRSWSDTKRRIKDRIDGGREATVKSTDDLMKIIEEGSLQKMLILTHPPNWRDDFRGWLSWLILQQFKNIGKTCLKIYWRQNSKSKGL